MKNLILYFTGTGNSLEVAKLIGKQLENIEIKNIMTIDSKKKLDDYDSIGFIYPCYKMGTPSFIRRKILNLNLSKKIYYYGVTSAGSSRTLGTGKQLSDTLQSKGCKLSYYNNIKMVSNNITLYNPGSEEDAKAMAPRVQEKCNEIVYAVKAKEEIEIKSKGLWLSNLLQKIGNNSKKSRDTKFYTTSDCNGCGLCSKVCKLDNIDMVDGKPKWKGNCVGCTACIQWCPTHAIEYGKKTKNRRRYRNPNIKVNEI